MRIFISSVQKEFARERKALGEYLSNTEPQYIQLCRIGTPIT